MDCPDCKREMLLLFRSFVCDYCDGLTDEEHYDGYIVYQPARVDAGAPFQVFRTATSAAIYRSARGMGECEIRRVRSLDDFTWIKSRGSLDVELADRPFEVFRSHRYERKPGRAFLAPT